MGLGCKTVIEWEMLIKKKVGGDCAYGNRRLKQSQVETMEITNKNLLC